MKGEGQKFFMDGATKPLLQLHLVQIHRKDGVFFLRLTGDTQTRKVPPLMRKSVLYKVQHMDEAIIWDCVVLTFPMLYLLADSQKRSFPGWQFSPVLKII